MEFFARSADIQFLLFTYVFCVPVASLRHRVNSAVECASYPQSGTANGSGSPQTFVFMLYRGVLPALGPKTWYVMTQYSILNQVKRLTWSSDDCYCHQVYSAITQGRLLLSISVKKVSFITPGTGSFLKGNIRSAVQEFLVFYGT